MLGSQCLNLDLIGPECGLSIGVFKVESDVQPRS